MATSNEIDFDSPFVKKEKSCKICGATDGPMESIFCKADDTALLDKIYKCTRVEVTPVCGLISPICEYCNRRIDDFDENAPPKVVEFVIKNEMEHDSLEHDPLNVADDPMAVEVKSEVDEDEYSDYSRHKSTKRKERKARVIVDPWQIVQRNGRTGRNAKTHDVTRNRFNVREKENDVEDRQTTDSEEGDEEAEQRKRTVRRNGKDRKSSQELDDSSLKLDESDAESDDDESLMSGDKSDLDDDVEAYDASTNSEADIPQAKKRGQPRRRPHPAESPPARTKKRKKPGTPEQCEVCGKTVLYIREHMRLHQIERQHPCPHCDRTFVQVNNLKYHIRKHMGEKPYPCKQCDKRFYCEAHLRSHMRVHGPQGLFQCVLCPKSFNQDCNLKKHLRVHSGEKPYGCNTCGKRFNSSSNLRNHARLHAIERQLTCEHCSKCFVDVHHLQRHIRVHTGERPYICHVCSQSYYCQNGLMEHLKTHIEKRGPQIEQKAGREEKVPIKE
ncbi:zinc finger protein 37-like [Anopheles nili]|uniref:zinc finger protein 37-like n=1 Tax=Anopheles nili TaxID=185578 RepID=UPI00237BFFD8|nr:zinc finger protein 37-like [Anopheles nili]